MRHFLMTGFFLIASCCPCGSGSSGTGGDAGSAGGLQSTTGAGGVGGHGNTMPAGGFGGGAQPVCLCDCPEGPPAPPAIDTFCADDAHAGAVCCRKVDGSETGLCVGHECVVASGHAR